MLTKELIESYKATIYRVPSLNLDVRIDEKNSKLDMFLKKQCAETWAFITAWNPKSKLISPQINFEKNEVLRAELKDYEIFDSIGIPLDSKWIPEQSFFILNISKRESNILAKRFGQNAFLFGEVRQLPTLVIT